MRKYCVLHSHSRRSDLCDETSFQVRIIKSGPRRELQAWYNKLLPRFTALDVVIAEAIAIALFLLLAGACSAAREGLHALENEERFQGVDRGLRGDHLVQWWRDRRKAVLLVLGLGNRLGLIGATTLTVIFAVERFAAELPLLIALVASLTILFVVLIDVLPTTIARAYPQRIAIASIVALRVPYFLLYPLIKVLLISKQGLLRLLGEDGTYGRQSSFASALEILAAGGRPGAEERQMLLETLASSEEVIVREVMVPRTDMVTISMDMNFEEILVTLLECGHSRIPVYGESHDEILGIFYAKDLISLIASGREFRLENFLRKPYFVPETRMIAELLKDFQQKRTHMAIVVDEFGGTAGIITMEDIIEEFFGDIQDEYDVEPSQLVEIGENRVIADARIGIDEIEDYFDVEMPDEPDYDSLGGFLLSWKGSVPRPGDEIRFKHLLFRIVSANAKRIDSVEIKAVPQESEAA